MSCFLFLDWLCCKGVIGFVSCILPIMVCKSMFWSKWWNISSNKWIQYDKITFTLRKITHMHNSSHFYWRQIWNNQKLNNNWNIIFGCKSISIFAPVGKVLLHLWQPSLYFSIIRVFWVTMMKVRFVWNTY